MATSTWTRGVSGDWNVAANWTGNVPNSGATDVVIDAVPTATSYLVTIAGGASDLVNSISLNATNNALGTNQSPYKAAELEVDGTLTFAPGSTGAISGPLQNVMLMNSGSIANAGTIDAFVQAGGITRFTGANAIYFTNWLQSIGNTTIDTSSIGEYNATTKTLFDGIFEAKGATSTVNLGGAVGKNIVDITTLQGPKATFTENFWTQLIMDSTGSEINQWNGTAYVPIESTLTTIGESGILTVAAGRSYTTTNALSVLSDGVIEETSGTLTTAGLNIAIGGTLTNGSSGQGPKVFSASTDTTALTVAGPITNNGTVVSFGPGIKFAGAVAGTGSMTFGATGGTIEVNAVTGQNVVLGNGDTLVLDTPASFKGTITAPTQGGSIVLKNTTATTVTDVNGAITVSNGGNVITTITAPGTLPALSVREVGGDAIINLGTASALAITNGLGLAPTPTLVAGANTVTSTANVTSAGSTLSSTLNTLGGDGGAASSLIPTVPTAAGNTTVITPPTVASIGALDLNSGNIIVPTTRGG